MERLFWSIDGRKGTAEKKKLVLHFLPCTESPPKKDRKWFKVAKEGNFNNFMTQSQAESWLTTIQIKTIIYR